MTGIFISYRQDDAKPWAFLLRKELVDVFGEEHVFLGKDAWQAGNWRTQVQKDLNCCNIALIVIGKRWLPIVDDGDRSPLDGEDDVHRYEIVQALSRKDFTVIPVTVDGAPMPRSEELPPEMRSLTEQQGRNLSASSAHWEVDLKLLIADIQRATALKGAYLAPNQEAAGGKAVGTAAHPRIPLRAIIISAVVSIVLVVLADIWLDSRFDRREKSLVVFIVLLLTLGGIWLRNRMRGKKK